MADLYRPRRRFASGVVTPPVGEWIEGEIPFLAYRGVVEDNSNQNFTGFVNGSNLDNNSSIFDGGLLGNERVLFYFPESWECEFTRIEYGDFEGSQAGEGLATAFIQPDFTEVAGPRFKGLGYNTTEVHELETPVRANYFYFRQTYPTPSEIRFYGRRRNVQAPVWQRKTHAIQNLIGAVIQPYDINKGSFQGLDYAKLAVADSVHIYREYVDLGTIQHRDETVSPSVPSGLFTFQPCFSGYWSLDDQLANRKAAGKRVVFNLKGSIGATAFKPGLKQAVIRYGHNQNVSLSEVLINTLGPSANEIKIGLGLVDWWQLDNEPTRWWKQIADLINQMNLEGMIVPSDLAILVAECEQIIHGVDPTAKIAGPGMPSNSPAFFISMALQWKKMGLTRCPLDAWCYHEYPNESGIQNQTGGEPKGVSPELAGVYNRAITLQQVIKEQYPDQEIELWITETGYSVQDPVTGNQNNIAKNFPDRSNRLTQGDWSGRLIMDLARAGLAVNMFYQGYDDASFKENPTLNFPWDLTCGIWFEDFDGTVSLRPVSRKFQQMQTLLWDYHMTGPAPYPLAAVAVDKLEKPGAPIIYALVSPTENRTVVPYSFTVPTGKTGKLVRLSDYSTTPVETPLSVGVNQIDVTEDTCFIVVS